ISLYMGGYSLEILKNVMSGDKHNLPELSPISSKLKSGFKLLIMHLPQHFILSLAGIPLWWSYFSVVFYRFNHTTSIQVSIILLLIFGIIYLILALVINYIIAPAQLFIFSKYGLK